MSGQAPDLDDLLDSALDDLEELEIEEKNRPKQSPPTTTHTSSTPTPTQGPPLSTLLSTLTPPTAPTIGGGGVGGGLSEDILSEQFVSEMRRIMDDFNKGDLEGTLKEIERMAQAMGAPLDPTLPPHSPSSPTRTPTSTHPSTSHPHGHTHPTTSSSNLSATPASDSTPPTHPPTNAPTNASGGGGGGGGGGSFEENMVNTLRMLAENAKNVEGGGDDMEGMESLMAGFENNPEFQAMMDGMITQLISKDILYDAMKELREKYPGYLKAQEGILPEDDYRRYMRQYECVQKICTLYEGAGDPSQQVIGLMQEMAECGQPPQEIISDLAPGMQFGADGMPIVPHPPPHPQADGMPAMPGAPGQQQCNIM